MIVKKKLFIFDIEGVLVNHMDDPKPLSYSIDLINYLREKDKIIVLLTNIGRKSSNWVFKKLTEIGFKLNYDEVFTAGRVLAEMLKDSERKCFILGEEGLIEELISKGINIVKDEKADTVILGACRNINYWDLNFAMNLLLKNAEFFCVGGSLRFKGKLYGYEGEFLGEGALAEALSLATGKKVNYIGKPYKDIFLHVLKRYDVKKEDCIMVGDSLDSDILGAFNIGIDSVWVSHGRNLPEKYYGKIKVIVKDLEELYNLIQKS
ncbi:Ribonucleotide monophosphatase NagD [archaeon HR06]|nr:Ribonucleotide monophosphatase NagD [archaeon HR06]